MTKDDIIQKLRESNRAEVARQLKSAGISYGYLSKLVYGDIEDPGHTKIDTLRSYFLAQEFKQQ